MYLFIFKAMKNTLFTIGHSNHTVADFLLLLKKYAITVVADVRSAPYSQFNPQFNREAIETSLENDKIRYVFLGKELGARPNDNSCYIGNHVDFEILKQQSFFQDGIRRILEGIENNYRIALMCSEKEPLLCHRTILICRYLKKYNLEINHILFDGSIEKHIDTEARLMHLMKLEPTLFERDTEALISSAYNLQSEKISYTKEGVL